MVQVSGQGTQARRLLATSDLHVSHRDNRPIVEAMRPGSPDDWLIVAGDVAESPRDLEWTLRLLRERFATVIWVPGNHELWTLPRDGHESEPGSPARLRGVARYEHLVDVCRSLDVVSPEDPYPVWDGPGGPAVVAPLFVLYDYTFRPAGTTTKQAALDVAVGAGVVCTDEVYLHPDPHPTRDAWCHARLATTEARLAAVDPDLPTVLVNHFPLVREPTWVLRYPEFALWCGTEGTADWHRRFRATAVVYGHLHIPRTTWYDGVRFEEVSVGYPREWRRRGHPRGVLRQILPAV
jgi:3',5'-cyclic AMP phosphodiesterase CpdA